MTNKGVPPVLRQANPPVVRLSPEEADKARTAEFRPLPVPPETIGSTALHGSIDVLPGGSDYIPAARQPDIVDAEIVENPLGAALEALPPARSAAELLLPERIGDGAPPVVDRGVRVPRRQVDAAYNSDPQPRVGTTTDHAA